MRERLLFKQRIFSWFDSYDIYHEDGSVAYTVKGKLSWGHKFVIFDPIGNELGSVQQKVLSFLPRFDFYGPGERYLGSMKKRFCFLQPSYALDFLGWQIKGTWTEWEYTISDSEEKEVAVISKELWHLTDTYVIDTYNHDDALYVLMFVLSIDAEKCSRQS